MHRYVVALAVLCLAGCATSLSPNTYQINDGGPEFRYEAAEEAHRQAANTAGLGAGSFDAPVQLLRSPQPVMPRKDIAERVSGRVVVDILFGEAGTVEDTRIIESWKDSLSQAVVAAVSQWVIAPATKAGKPVKVTARQSFKFESTR
jgi:TonB family protein